MSFASDLKKDIVNYDYLDASLKAELYGILKLKSEMIVSNNNLSLMIKTTSLNLSRRIIYIIKKLYHIDIEILSKKRMSLDKKNVYILLIEDSIKEMLADLDIMNEDYEFTDSISSIYKDTYADVIRGMYLSNGSVNDPNKSYHLEIACSEEYEAKYIVNTVRKIGIDGKITKRRGKYVFYIKKGEQIGDFLKLLGSTTSLFDFENARIKRDLSNVVNRVINCDIHNSTKTRLSCDKQLDDIRTIKKYMGFDNLSIRLMEAITLRVKNPDSSLQELSDVSEEVVGRYISKSGISHCMKDLEIIAGTLKNKKAKEKNWLIFLS